MDKGYYEPSMRQVHNVRSSVAEKEKQINYTPLFIQQETFNRQSECKPPLTPTEELDKNVLIFCLVIQTKHRINMGARGEGTLW